MKKVLSRSRKALEQGGEMETLPNGERVFHYRGRQYQIPRYICRTYRHDSGSWGWSLMIPGRPRFALTDTDGDPLGCLADILVLRQENMPKGKNPGRHVLRNWSSAHNELGVPGAVLRTCHNRKGHPCSYQVSVRAGDKNYMTQTFPLRTSLERMRRYAEDARQQLVAIYHQKHGKPLLSGETRNFRRLDPMNLSLLEKIAADDRTTSPASKSSKAEKAEKSKRAKGVKAPNKTVPNKTVPLSPKPRTISS